MFCLTKRFEHYIGKLFLLLSLNMNFLAHAYLSFNDPLILAGNMASDYIKGRTQYDYEIGIQRGIQLHRSIDAFTDAHPCTKAINQLFHPHYRLYSGAITDIVYDYFLANDAHVFASAAALQVFSMRTYALLQPNIHKLPVPFQHFFPFMQSQDWLYHYRTKEGIQKSLQGLVRRAKYLSEADTAYGLFNENIAIIKPIYQTYFPLLKKYSEECLQILLAADCTTFEIKK